MRLNTACLVATFAMSFTSVSAFAQEAKPKASSTPASTAPAAATTGATTTKVGATSATSTTSATATTPTPAGSASATAGAATTAPTAPAPAAATPAAAPPSSTTAAASATPAAGGPPDGSTYVVRLRDLEQRIDELKEQIRRSHTRLSLLSDTILSGGVGGARAEIVFRNDISSAFRLTGVVIVLDGVVQYNKQDDSEGASLSSQKEIPVFSGAVPPGDHTLQVVVRLQGHGYGVFSYLRGYKFDVKSSHAFTITEGKTISVEAVAWEKGDVTTPLEQRPAVRFSENLKTGFAAEAAPAAGSPAASGSVSAGAGAK